MAPSTPLTPRRARVIAERQSLEQQINQQAEEFAPPTPNSPACTGTCHYIKRLCYGRGEVFDNIGCFSGLCISRDHRATQRFCTKARFLTPPLPNWQLDVLRALCIKFDLTGKKWGKQDVPAYLLGRVPSLTPPIPSGHHAPALPAPTTPACIVAATPARANATTPARTNAATPVHAEAATPARAVATTSARDARATSSNLTTRKWKRAPSPIPPHVPVRVIDLEVVDLTVPTHKKRRIVVDLEVIDLTD
ncbi:hypothetical protein C8R44DRAFT_867176 [Mycena epipterygia]|nr:hypothetical protein C8R44DRAFT_867176 [Mycena epipterygia]